MGSCSRQPIYVSAVQESFEAEEYDLEILDSSYPVPVESSLHTRTLFSKSASSTLNSSQLPNSFLFKNRTILKKNHFAYRNVSLQETSSTATRVAASIENSAHLSWKTSTLPHHLKRLNQRSPHSYTRSTRLECLKKDKDRFRRKQVESFAHQQGEKASGDHHLGNIHDDLSASSYYSCHTLDKKGRDSLARGSRPRLGLLQATMSDQDRAPSGKGTNKGRHRSSMGHQLPFLKTVSIIDTLSELGPEVRQLADEPRYSEAIRLHPTSRNARHQQNNSISENKDDKIDPPPLPLVSPDFQQYTEKIYDAVTRRPDLPLTETLNPAHKYFNFGKSSRSNSQLSASLSGENGLGVRVEDGSSRRRVKHLDYRGRERGRTPDWIKRIFNIAKKGDLEGLKHAIADMEGTLVRNLSDHAGNNLLHVMAVFGHLEPMAWLLTKQPILVDGLQDENKFGLTPLVYAIKYGHLHLVQWLVANTRAKEKVRCKDGERSLLHIGAKYAQEDIVAWLVNYMMSHEISLDNKDHHGNTALHLASRTGNARICTILLQHGGDVTLKNDLGQKAWEVCFVRGHLACAEYLCVHESGLALASDLTRREAELEAAMTDNHDLRISFKEVMSVARRLCREREEAVRELSRLHDQMIDAHDNIIMALQVLAEENTSLRERVNGVRHIQHPRDRVETVTGLVTNLHEKWRAAQKTWFGSSFVNIKHRLLLVEESWKKLRHRSHRTVASTHHPLDIFRGKLCAIRAQGGEGKLGDLPSLCSSEESIVSLFPFSDNEGDEDKNTETVPSSLPLASTPKGQNGYSSINEIYSKKSAIKEPSKPRYDVLLNSDESSDLTTPKRGDNSENMMADSIVSPIEATSSVNNSNKISESVLRPYWNDPNASLNVLSELSLNEHFPKDTINSRLKSLALISESGSCSVLEVIEPSSDESDVLPEDDKPARSISLLNSEAIVQGNPSRSPRDVRGRMPRINEDNDGLGHVETITTSSESGGDCSASQEILQRGDITSQNKLDGNHFLANETSAVTAGVDVSDSRQRSQEGDEELDISSITSPTISTIKRKGFLHKFIKPPKWSAKRKVKTLQKIDSGTSRDFKNPYSLVNVKPTESCLSLGDTDQQTTPESNTSSSHEYSNSSEESSIGKPTGPRILPTINPNSISIESDTKSYSLISSNSVKNFDQNSEKRKEISMDLVSVSSRTPPPIPLRRAIPSLSSSNSSVGFEVNKNKHSTPEVVDLSSKKLPEVRSVSASEDSGIVARSSSSASKTESLSRPESSSSNFPPFKTDYHPLQKSNLSLTQDMLQTPDSSTGGRMSPAPSEVSKTESALSPPSHASDVSKSESSRQISLGKRSAESSMNSNCSKDSSAGSFDYSLALLPMKKELSVKTAAIIDISCDQQTGCRTLDTPTGAQQGVITESKKEKPWYEISDEESDILLPDNLSSKLTSGTSSSEDDVGVC